MSGLYRFDGIRFERYRPPAGQSLRSNDISALRVLSDGSLWVGYRFGGASRITTSKLTTFSADDGLPSSTVWDLTRDSSGTIWAATRAGIFRLAGARWQPFELDGQTPTPHALSMLTDRHGTVWAATSAGVFALRRGGDRFTRRGPPLGDVVGGAIREAPDGSVWGASMTAGLVLLSASTKETLAERTDVGRSGARTLLIDHSGALWMTVGDRLRRLARPSRTTVTSRSAFDAENELPRASHAAVLAMLEDREGNVWIGGEHGLERFRETKLTRALIPRAVLGPALATGDAGTVWLGAAVGGMYSLGPTTRRIADGPSDISCMYRDRLGQLWVGTDHGLWQRRDGKFLRTALPARFAKASIQALARDRSGRLWLSAVGAGVIRLTDGTWSDFGADAGLENTPAISIVEDGSDRVWLGYTGGRLALVVRRADGSDSTRLFTNADGVRVGNVSAVFVRNSRVWVGGDHGIAYLEGTRFRSVAFAGDEAPRGVSGIVETIDGDLWLNGADGVMRLPADELREARRDSSFQVRPERFDYRDGIDGIAPQIRPQPSVIESTDGRLWFVTSSQVLSVDPRRVLRNALAPPVAILELTSRARVQAPSDRIVLPPLTTALQVRYTALSLSVPDRVRFKYRLDGADTTWQDAGTRREAFFTNLRPGSYRFRVTAANEDGVWNARGDSIDVVITPTFAQTPAFLALCVLVAVAAIWLLLQRRVRRADAAARAQFEVTLAERTRIARELHDTLLQDFSGVAMQLHAVQRLLDTRTEQAAQVLTRAIATADVALRDARHAVWEMRSPELDSLDLPEALEAAARTALSSAGTAVTIDVRGERRRLPDEISVTAFRIGREAVANAARHAHANRVTLDFVYEATQFTLRIQDDGQGFSATSSTTTPEGHWGIVGMRERARRVGGSLNVTTAVGEGTLVVLQLPLPRES